jgi:uncharacterized protein YcfL
MHCNFKKKCLPLSVAILCIMLAGCHSQHTDNTGENQGKGVSKLASSHDNRMSLPLMSPSSSSSLSSSNMSLINVEKGFGQLKWNDSPALLKNTKESPAIEKEMLSIIGVAFNCYVSVPEENSFLQNTSDSSINEVDNDNDNNKQIHLYGYCFKGNHLALGVEMSADSHFYDTLYRWHQQHYGQMTNQTMIRIKSVNSQWLIKTHHQVLASMFYQSPEKHIAMWFVDNVPITLHNLSPKEIQKMQDDDESDDSSDTPVS